MVQMVPNKDIHGGRVIVQSGHMTSYLGNNFHLVQMVPNKDIHGGRVIAHKIRSDHMTFHLGHNFPFSYKSLTIVL